MPTTIGRRNERYEWLIDLMCLKCKSKWYICSVCSNVKTQLTTSNQIRRHQYGKEHKKNNSNSMNDNDVISQGEKNLDNLASSEPTTSITNSAINNELVTNHITKKKIIYFSIPKFRT